MANHALGVDYGIAVSLGAPIWFDFLNKFVNVRASGKAPEGGPKPAKEVLFLSNLGAELIRPHEPAKSAWIDQPTTVKEASLMAN
jgi:hypothetical protein